MSESFSDRHGYRLNDAEIVVREGAPPSLRSALPMLARKLGMSYSDIREVVCQTLLVSPDPGSWSEIPNIRDEIIQCMDNCEWFKVYDVAEALCKKLGQSFSDELNRLFNEKGIGWEVRQGEITYRGPKTFEETTRRSVVELEDTRRPKAAGEMREAIRDMSRRPDPDVTGAVQHATAAVEATARDVMGDPNRTLGQLVKSLGLPPPLDKAVEKLWGFASDRARHVREGQDLDTTDAELLVGVAGAICTFLAKRNDNSVERREE